MTPRALVTRLSQNERLNFVLTNCLPRRLTTRLVGWLSKIEQPLIRDLSIAVWRFFCPLDLREAKKTHFTSLRDCFIRELKDGARPIDPDPRILISPCDGIVVSCGRVVEGALLQVKGSTYPLAELLRDPALAASYRDGAYVTLRLTAGMYHRFHAPHDGRLEHLTHIWGDTWNVNPPTLARVPHLYCRNERAILRTRLGRGQHLVTLVPVAAILVAGIRLHCADLLLDPRQSTTLPGEITFRKGDELGWFEHGSTIIVLAPAGAVLCENVRAGETLRMGEPLLLFS